MPNLERHDAYKRLEVALCVFEGLLTGADPLDHDNIENCALASFYAADMFLAAAGRTPVFPPDFWPFEEIGEGLKKSIEQRLRHK